MRSRTVRIRAVGRLDVVLRTLQGLPTFLCKVRSKTTDTSSSTALLTRLRHATTYNFERLASHASRFMQGTHMSTFTAQGQQLVSDFSSRTGFSQDAVTHMLIAVLNGNGTMAQFSHPEFGGSGQWMRGGMMMIGDMFNHQLKGRVDALCSELANALASSPGLMQSGSFQSQTQGGGPASPQVASPFFVPDRARSGFRRSSARRARPVRRTTSGMPTLRTRTGLPWTPVLTSGCTTPSIIRSADSPSSRQFRLADVCEPVRPVNIATLPVVYRNGHPVTPSPGPGVERTQFDISRVGLRSHRAACGAEVQGHLVRAGVRDEEGRALAGSDHLGFCCVGASPATRR